MSQQRREHNVSHERGRFFIGPNGHPRFAGSSSGVYLADTLRTELSPAAQEEEIEEAFIARNNRKPNTPLGTTSHTDTSGPLKVKDFSDEETIRIHFRHYFQKWHPLFPFLDGVTLSERLERVFEPVHKIASITEEQDFTVSIDARSLDALFGTSQEEAIVISTIFRAVLTLGKSSGGRSFPIPGCQDTSIATKSPLYYQDFKQVLHSANAISMFCLASLIPETLGLQGLLAVQLCLFGMRETRSAMHIGGIIIKITYEAGLHRCPIRFQQTFQSQQERMLRRRIFYSVYVMDRLLSAEFGIPIMLNDTDIDTCIPGEIEKHQDGSVSPVHPARDHSQPTEVVSTRLNKRKHDGATDFGRLAPKKRRMDTSPLTALQADTDISAPRPSMDREEGSEFARQPAFDADQGDAERLAPTIALIKMAGMIGRAMETFNKSLRFRCEQLEDALYLRAELDTWWNDLGIDPDDQLPLSSRQDSEPVMHTQQFATLLTCLYHQQIINLNRPVLSISPSAVQYTAALQSSISSVRTICRTLTRQLVANADDLCWPGFVDMLFFGSLILVYGARKQKQSDSSIRLLHRDLDRILKLLDHLDERWHNLKPLIKIVACFVSPGKVVSHTHPILDDANAPGRSSILPDDFEFWLQDIALPEEGAPLGGDFQFNFESFELNPNASWAYRMSIPNSPAL